jgi:hypothetical protein
MQQLGMPAGLCNALCFQWNHQRRLLQWQQDILARPLETAVAIPQGDALSPLALGVYMYAGLRFVEVQTPENAQQRQRSIYMDDRTWTCSSPALLMQTLRSCETFSNSIGLQENPEKTQLVGSSQYRRRRLKEELADQRLLAEKVSSSALVLGCSTGKARCIQKKEKQRIEAAKALYARQSILPVKHRTKLNDQRSLGVSKAAYGWVANTSPQSHSTDHDKMARKASRPFTQVAINLHNLLEDTGCDRNQTGSPVFEEEMHGVLDMATRQSQPNRARGGPVVDRPWLGANSTRMASSSAWQRTSHRLCTR